MITSQLVAYIRTQLSANVPRETIRQSLLVNGWTEREVAEAMASVLPKTPVAIAIARPSLAGKKFALSLGFILVSAVYVIWQNVSGGQNILSQATGASATPGQSYKAANEALLQTLSQIENSTATGPVPGPTAAGSPRAPSPAPTPTPAPAPQKPTGLYADGSYNGTTADAYYGTVQVKAVITNGQLADVQFVQYPNTHSTSVYINEQAMPLLTQEAIQAQSANVSGVSGATFTSQAFQQSLASALALAKN